LSGGHVGGVWRVETSGFERFEFVRVGREVCDVVATVVSGVEKLSVVRRE
jgi:hypothetical protein